MKYNFKYIGSELNIDNVVIALYVKAVTALYARYCQKLPIFFSNDLKNTNINCYYKTTQLYKLQCLLTSSYKYVPLTMDSVYILRCILAQINTEPR